MVDDVILSKIDSIHRCLDRIREKLAEDPLLTGFDRQDVVSLNLQRAIQAVLDIGAHIIAERQLRLPVDSRDIFFSLSEAGFFDRDHAERLAKMVGFRNISVHDYQAVMPEILQSIVTHHLSDFEVFIKVVVENCHPRMWKSR